MNNRQNGFWVIEKAYLLNDYAQGKDTGIIDLLLVGNIDNFHLHDLSKKTERYLKRKIQHLVLTKHNRPSGAIDMGRNISDSFEGYELKAINGIRLLNY